MKTKLILASLLAIACSSAMAKPLMNESPKAKIYDCRETVTKISLYGNPVGTKRIGEMQIVDFGDSFFAINPEANATSFSGFLASDIDGFKTNTPVDGVTMGKGIGENDGTYIYIGTTYLISWDCRK